MGNTLIATFVSFTTSFTQSYVQKVIYAVMTLTILILLKVFCMRRSLSAGQNDVLKNTKFNHMKYLNLYNDKASFVSIIF